MARAAWLLWVYIAIILQLFAFVLIYKQTTMTQFEKSKLLGEDQRKLLDSTDGPARYGAGMIYRKCMIYSLEFDIAV